MRLVQVATLDHVVLGDADNLKVTHPADLAIVERALEARSENSGSEV